MILGAKPIVVFVTDLGVFATFIKELGEADIIIVTGSGAQPEKFQAVFNCSEYIVDRVDEDAGLSEYSLPKDPPKYPFHRVRAIRPGSTHSTRTKHYTRRWGRRRL